MVNALPFIYQPDRVALQASNVSAAEYQKRKKFSYFYACAVTAFFGAGNLINHLSLYDNGSYFIKRLIAVHILWYKNTCVKDTKVKSENAP